MRQRHCLAPAAIAGMVLFAATAPAKTIETQRFVPGNPALGQPALHCRMTVIEDRTLFWVKRRVSEACAPTSQRQVLRRAQ